MPKENTTMYIILGLLTHEAMSGYDLKKRIDASIGNFWDVGYGQIYPTLKVLEEEGHVTKKSDGNSKGPERYTYSITEAGRDRLARWLGVPGDSEYVKYEILLKLFFGRLLPVEENIGRVMEFRKRNAGRLATIEAFKQNLGSVLGESADHYYYYLTVLFGEHVYKAFIEWSDEAVKLLGNMKGGKSEEEKA